MSFFRIQGSKNLSGGIRISGSKNSSLALMVGAALGEEDVVLTNFPQDLDAVVLAEILRAVGVKVEEQAPGRVLINGSGLRPAPIPYELARKIRGSFYIAGLMLARLKEAEIPLPGGCFLGPRPVDFHIKGFQALGAEVSIEHGLMKARMGTGTENRFFINRSSVGTTINLMYLASLTPGVFVLENAAKEPEIVDLAVLLNSMGARIRGAGTEVIRIHGMKKLKGSEHAIIPDRIEAGTYMMAIAATGGDAVLENVMPDHLRTPIMKLRETGTVVEVGETSIRVVAKEPLQSTDLETAPYPGFPTDLQQPFGVLMSIANGTGIIRETVFDNRFRYLDELTRMGADVKVDRDRAIIKGVPVLSGAPVETTDLRAGAALVIAGLAAEGVTLVSGVEVIDRGYEKIVEKLQGVGAEIERLHTTEDCKEVI
ncbi:MAG TPA: UDP-N-acetylglucosamine 1-carboxyvinyltransferase [Firmicutes bacterium]|jgi:UDP-N-acetylglucosamine 1-carboxyvinyltransferase|nr:UDP-N-acetylglucosamine 1-carboxyvinyltransferase [Bacillota bacterium]